MNSKQKQDKVNSLNQLIPLLSEFPDTQGDGIDERIVLKKEIQKEIQKECKHVFINHGCLEVCECGKTKMT